jgi:hypothetical protein
MLELDERQDPHADVIRDMMDPLWYELTAADRKILDARDLREVRVIEYARLSIGPALFQPPPPVPQSGDLKVEIRDWKGAA